MRVTELAQVRVREVVEAGERVVDATVGNGYDTVFLAELVGESGRVVGFDVQREALESARFRLEGAGLLERVSLLEEGHELMAEGVESGVGAVMFNLGYLPGSDKVRTTGLETTLRALEGAVGLLRVGGVVTVVCYRGHEGGEEEARGVLDWAQGLATRFAVELPEGREAQGAATTYSWPEGEGPFLVVVRRG